MSKKIATIIGATGKQGGAAINVFLQKPEYLVRGITRNADSSAARALKARGVEVVQADLNDEATLRVAFEGSHVIFGTTDFVPGFVQYGSERGRDIEAEQGRNVARAAQATPTLEHLIWSTLPSTSKISNGKYACPNFEGKEAANDFIRTLPDLLAKTTFVLVGWYDLNFNYPCYKPVWVEAANRYVVIGDYDPDATLVYIGDVEKNLGPFVKAIAEQPEKTKNGAIVFAYTDTIGFEELLKRWAKAKGKEAAYVSTSYEIMGVLYPEWTKLADMTRWMGDYKDTYWSYKEGEFLSYKDLGIAISDFVSMDESLKYLEIA
ncbi:hypothetical protein TRIATDRAFT_190528 [Trichoderma atroviride IMI 206040]|uniref:NmrA-like domain-containing protein n=1 Tax=Hypocrea atroviridis (strain ATCC 20476 / IMI 206040) TaxID=452589 RepID=G9NK98_HYPAI|nr:uncharacterized protein TRIATDRAFT_190528 [Trichoderma atroviride IMI 206040]EHK49316.1 hypothetical protein TRIATDRAFT_190528 [Trichoderma atroviride IMI 206040]